MASGLVDEYGLMGLPYTPIGFLGLVGLKLPYGPMSLKIELGFNLLSLRSPRYSAWTVSGRTTKIPTSKSFIADLVTPTSYTSITRPTIQLIPIVLSPLFVPVQR